MKESKKQSEIDVDGFQKQIGILLSFQMRTLLLHEFITILFGFRFGHISEGKRAYIFILAVHEKKHLHLILYCLLYIDLLKCIAAIYHAIALLLLLVLARVFLGDLNRFSIDSVFCA